MTEPAILCNIICDIHYFVLIKYYILKRASLMAQTVKRLPAMRETWVQSVIPFFVVVLACLSFVQGPFLFCVFKTVFFFSLEE